ncbi:helix-turn-helix domain-containing protein [Aliiglaciecola sp. CAU 1673]|uniref:helix-turn-helix domain-containing protein n=1 Tax=Aliiglaciecola sp. CAU 1673 TaxID=3032595 RepID=UPI0023DC297E|nr:helix-turn-helix domain-containing protein [Aliiglaciecola sp. CAU 1673]MDF2179374.1 helix-turn-helix domain-containing protein [Aliiglaciecola sp. CAU 1673]
MTAQILFFFSALGVFNGLLLSAYLLLKTPRNLGNALLALLLFMLSIRVGKSVFFFFSPALAKIYLQIGLSACLLIGPSLYLYCFFIMRSETISRLRWLHFLLPFATIVLIGVLFPYQQHEVLWGSYLYKLVNYVWFAYLAFSFLLIRPLLLDLFKGNSRLHPAQTLCISAAIGTSLIWLAYVTGSYTSYISGALSFSLILYLSVLIVLFSRRESRQAKYQDKKIEPDEAQQLAAKLTRLMREEQLYLDANLTLAQLAKKLGTNTSRLSQFVNDNLSSTFPHYLNELRIDHAKALLLSNKSMSMEQIGEAAGFNSQSTFYSAFKKFTGTTPAKFRQQQKTDITNP